MKRPPFAASALIGPGLDLIGYFTAVAAGSSAGRSQIGGFLVAVAFGYLQSVRVPTAESGRRWDAALCIHSIVVVLLAFFLRSGVFAWLTSGCGWRGAAAIAPTVLATAAVLRPGFRYCASFSAWKLGCGTGWRQLAVAVVVFASALRLIYGAQVQLMPEETYYWNYSRHLDIGYLDHPPMVGWLIWLGTAVFGDTEFGVRAGAMCCAVIASLFAYRLTRNLVRRTERARGRGAAADAAVLFPDRHAHDAGCAAHGRVVAAAYFLERALIAGRANAWWGAGLCLGFGMLSKYTIGLLGLSAFLFMLFDAPARHWLRRWQPYAAACLAIAVFSPVILWNAHHEWASFVFQTSRRLAERPQIRAAQAHCLGRGAADADRPRGRGGCARQPGARGPPDKV